MYARMCARVNMCVEMILGEGNMLEVIIACNIESVREDVQAGV